MALSRMLNVTLSASFDIESSFGSSLNENQHQYANTNKYPRIFQLHRSSDNPASGRDSNIRIRFEHSFTHDTEPKRDNITISSSHVSFLAGLRTASDANHYLP